MNDWVITEFYAVRVNSDYSCGIHDCKITKGRLSLHLYYKDKYYSKYKYKLNPDDHFQDWSNPTDKELTMFELKYGVDISPAVKSRTFKKWFS